MVREIFHKNKKETLAYLFWGAASFGLNIALYTLLISVGVNYQLSHFVTLIAVKFFCYFTNKFFVFHSKCKNVRELMIEFIKFFVARMGTFLMDYFGLILLVEKLGADKYMSKIFLAVIVIIVNYCTSKAFAFRLKHDERKTLDKNEKGSM